MKDKLLDVLRKDELNDALDDFDISIKISANRKACASETRNKIQRSKSDVR